MEVLSQHLRRGGSSNSGHGSCGKESGRRDAGTGNSFEDERGCLDAGIGCQPWDETAKPARAAV